MPSQILFCAVGSPDILATFFPLAGLLVLIDSPAATSDRSMSHAIRGLVGGAIAGLGSSLKSFGIIVLLAWLLAALVEGWGNRSKMRRIALAAPCAFIAHSLVVRGVSAASQNWLGIDWVAGSSLPHFLLVGLNTQGEGQIHLGELSRLYYEHYSSNGLDWHEASQYTYSLLVKDWTSNPLGLLKLIPKKLIWAWQDDVVPWRYFTGSIGLDSTNGGLPYRLISVFGADLSEASYLILVLLGAFGCSNQYSQKTNLTALSCALAILGFFSLLLLSEAQSRYKILVMPYICVFTAIGISECATALRHGIDERRKRLRCLKRSTS